MTVWHAGRAARAAALAGLVAGLVALPVLSRRLDGNFFSWEHWRSAGYLGIFVLALVSSGGLVIPVPALAAVFLAGQALNPLLVAGAAAVGMTLGELTGYGLGVAGRAAVPEGLAALRWPALQNSNLRLLSRYGEWGLALLAFIPNPFFDVAGAAAGAAGMPPARFLLAVGAGKFAKTLLVALAGYWALNGLRGGIG